MGIVYKIICLITNKFYIGSTKQIGNTRKSNHFSSLRHKKHHSKYLQRAWNKYGESNFKYEVIEFCEVSIRKKREQYYLDTLLFAQEYIQSKGKDKRFHKFGYNANPLANHPYNETPWNKGLKFPEKSGRNHFASKAIVQLDLQGNFIANYDCITDARKKFNDRGVISACINKKIKIGLGYRWLTKNEYEEGNYKFSEPKTVNEKKSVLELDAKGNVLNKYESISAACSAHKIDIRQMSFYLNSNKRIKLFDRIFKFEKDFDLNKPFLLKKREYRTAKKVAMCDSDNKLLQQFDSISSAAKSLNKKGGARIINVLNTPKLAYGFKWITI